MARSDEVPARPERARSEATARPTSQPTTLADVARATGVAVSTVSRALSDPDRVNAATRERIRKAAAELDYTPNPQARALLSGRTKAVAVLVADVTNPFYFGIIRGTQRQLKAAGHTQLLIDTEESDELEDGMLHRLRRSFDGAIIAASRLTDRKLSQIAAEMPIVAINRQTRGVPSVFIDTPGGVLQGLEHLVSLGHREIVYAAGPDTSWSNARRWRAIVEGSRAHGIEPRRVGPYAPRRAAGAAAADAVVNSGATAVLAFNDLLAIGMLDRLRERGIRVPQDLSIVGCDDIFGADFCAPPLTTLTAPIERAGEAAVAMLLSRIEGRPIRTGAVLPTHLTVRASTGPVPSPVASPVPRKDPSA